MRHPQLQRSHRYHYHQQQEHQQRLLSHGAAGCSQRSAVAVTAPAAGGVARPQIMRQLHQSHQFHHQQQQQHQQRLLSHGAAGCSQRCAAAAFPTAAPRGRPRALRAWAHAAPPPKVVHMPSFLSREQFAAVQSEARRLQPKLRRELNCIAEGRLGCYLPPSSAAVAIFSSQELALALTQRLHSPLPLFLSDFPIELRQYPKGSSMPWHKDEQMYERPQWELIYTVDNTSDSTTEWRDAVGRQHSLWTEPNSLLAVEAEGWEHRVLPVRRGARTILKLAFTCTGAKVDAYQTNLAREAYSST